MVLDKQSSLVKLIVLFSILYGILLVVASIFPSPYFWGIRLIEFISFPAAVLLSIPFIAALIPNVRSIIISAVGSLFRLLHRQTTIVRYTILVVIAGILILKFWLFRQSLFFLGDGYLLIGSLVHVNWFSDIHIFYKNEPLPGLIEVCLDKLTMWFYHKSSAQFSIQLVSILFGIGSVYITFRIMRQFTNDGSAAFFALMCFLSTATSQLYFGYVENYSPVIFFLLIFLFFGIRFIKTKKYFITVVISYVLLFYSHYSMLCLFPAFIFLSYVIVKEKKNVEFILSSILGLILLALLILITYYPRTVFFERFLSSSNHLLPLFNEGTISFSYSLFSYRHILDIVNHYVFVFPFLILCGVFVIIDTYRLKLWKDQAMFFIMLSAVCTIVFGFLVKSDLGLSRDWDLFSLFIVPSILLVIIWILRIEGSMVQKNVFLIILLTTLAHTGTWIYINSDKETSFQYFRSLPNDGLWSKKANANAHSELARFYEQTQNYEASLFEYQTYLKYDPTNSRIWENLGGTYLYVFKDSAHAQKAYEKCVEYGRKSEVVFANLGEIYMKQQRYDSALVMLDRTLELNPDDAAAKNNKSFILTRMKKK